MSKEYTGEIVNPWDAAYKPGKLYRLAFGAYLNEIRYVWGTYGLAFDDALEVAAASLNPGDFTDPPDYAQAAEELGLSWPNDEGLCGERIMEKAETDMTYTESGWLLSWEWTGNEVTGPEYEAILARSLAIVQAECDHVGASDDDTKCPHCGIALAPLEP